MLQHLLCFVNRNEIIQQVQDVINIVGNGGVLAHNLYGFTGASGIGKTALLREIHTLAVNSNISTLFKADFNNPGAIRRKFDFLRNASGPTHAEPAISLVDDLDLIGPQIGSLKEAYDLFINTFLPKRVIFCTSKFPDHMATLLRPEQRKITELKAIATSYTYNMLDQIFPGINNRAKQLLNEYAAGYPVMIGIYEGIVSRKSINLKNMGPFLWKSLRELAKNLFPDSGSSNQRERSLLRICYFSLLDGFMPDIGIHLSKEIAELENKAELQFLSFKEFNNFCDGCINQGVFQWTKNDYVLFEPLMNMLRLYMHDFKKEQCAKIYSWLFNQYLALFRESQGKEKGYYLLRYTFCKHQLVPFSDTEFETFLKNHIDQLKRENNFDAIHFIKNEFPNSQIGKIFFNLGVC